MNPMLVLLLIALIPSVFAAVLAYWHFRGKTTPKEQGWLTFGVAILTLIFGWMIPTVFFVVTIPGQAVLFDKDLKVQGVITNVLNVWIWDSRAKLRQLRAEQRSLSLSMHAAPITDNPKVRSMHYELKLQVLGNVQVAAVYYPYVYRKPGWSTETDWLQSRLNNFNNDHSKEMAKFFDDKDPEQQKAFWTLVAGFLDPDLKAAQAKLVCVHFDLD